MGGLREVHADHLRDDADRQPRAVRHPAVRGILLEGRDHRGGASVDDPGPRLCVFVRAGGRLRHGVLHVPAGVHDVPRQARFGTSMRMAARTRSTIMNTPPARRRKARGSSRCRSIAARDSSVIAGWIYIQPMLFGDFFGTSDRRPAAARGSRGAGRGVAWRRRVHPARPRERAVLARHRRHRGRLRTCYLVRADAAGADRQGRRPDLRAPREQVLLRPLQRLVLRRRRAAPRNVLQERRRRLDHRRILRQRHGAGRSAGRRR